MSEPIRNRALGTLIGLAVGDALGTTLEFEARDAKPPVYDMVGGGPFDLLPGPWTDDMSMALCLADSLIACNGLNERDLMERFCRWYQVGENSCTGDCFDIGVTTREALELFRRADDPLAGTTDARTAGNGSIMRLAPVVLRYWNDAECLSEARQRQSYTTHGADEAVDACDALATVKASLIAGKPLKDVLAGSYGPFCPGVQAVMDGSYRGRARSAIRSSGYVVHTLEAALWCVSETRTFRDAVLSAVNLGDDADTVGAVTGQISRAAYGVSAIPEEWFNQTALNTVSNDVAFGLFRAGFSELCTANRIENESDRRHQLSRSSRKRFISQPISPIDDLAEIDNTVGARKQARQNNRSTAPLISNPIRDYFGLYAQ